MDYELAKKLKDAGYPQKGDLLITKDYLVLCCASTEDNCYCPRCTDGMYESIMQKKQDKTEDYCVVPTLTELLIACGERFNTLCAHQKDEKIYQWCAHSVNPLPWKKTYGGTPEEAVANLWLELNKK